MIKEFIHSEIDDLFGSKDALAHSYEFGEKFTRWERVVHGFSEDIFRKWLASRSATAVNQLLDAGIATRDEQKIVKSLEHELSLFFDSSLGSFFKSLRVPALSAWAGMLLGTPILITLFICCSNRMWKFSTICILVGWICFSAATILHSVDRNTLSRKVKRFLVQFFVDAENKWMDLQKQYIQQDKDVQP